MPLGFAVGVFLSEEEAPQAILGHLAAPGAVFGLITGPTGVLFLVLPKAHLGGADVRGRPPELCSGRWRATTVLTRHNRRRRGASK